jgi:hypothetical protein
LLTGWCDTNSYEVPSIDTSDAVALVRPLTTLFALLLCCRTRIFVAIESKKDTRVVCWMCIAHVRPCRRILAYACTHVHCVGLTQTRACASAHTRNRTCAHMRVRTFVHTGMLSHKRAHAPGCVCTCAVTRTCIPVRSKGRSTLCSFVYKHTSADVQHVVVEMGTLRTAFRVRPRGQFC